LEDDETPRSVRTILRDMKDLSELMVDLAYSSVIFDLDDIGEEVLHLEEEISDLRYELEQHLLLAADTPEQAKSLTAILHVAATASEIASAAGDIAKIVVNDFRLHPIILEALKLAEERIVRVQVDKSSVLCEKSIEELALPLRLGAVIIHIRRGTRRIYDPDEDVILYPEDVLIVRTTETSAPVLREIAEGKRQEFP
jgi:uncharacterized protein with PhoU and TrkA domain